MRHTRQEIIKRTIQEFELLDHLVSNLSDGDWSRLLTRSETKVPLDSERCTGTHYPLEGRRGQKNQETTHTGRGERAQLD